MDDLAPDEDGRLVLSVEWPPDSARPLVILTADPGADDETRFMFSPLLATEVGKGMIAAAAVAADIQAARAAHRN